MKKKLRKEALAKRKEMPAEERKEKSRRITEHILQSEVYQKAKSVFSFVSMGTEAETRGILKQAWKDGKIVAVPKMKQGREMVFLKIESLADVKEGRFGVMEPVTQEERIPKAGDLFLVPGALFDRNKNRIGYGGGFYDTYFEKHQGYRKIGLAFSEQISETAIPTEVNDIPLDDIVTENGWEE